MALHTWTITSFPNPSALIPIVDSHVGVAVILSLLISNYDDIDNANIEMLITDNLNAITFKSVIMLPVGSSPFALDSRVVIKNSNKLQFRSDVVNVSVHVSVDQ